ncbi:GAF domain-containing protein [Lapillicoccus sp.]|uniref:GAF domain-containing sensor histidine kinase n=1 Tax=Lapillicoccus sp. TaxID=1909287 RepID=UPI00326601D0
MTASHERMSDLLEAVVAVSADLDLTDVLSRIVGSAVSLVGASYGALGVLSPGGEHLVEFITRGISAAEREEIGELPRGHGVLGLLIRDPRPRRLKDIAAHPDSFGFPPNHPPMRSFLGTPIRIRDKVYGNLYLAEKQGADEFTAEDEEILVALAAAAGVAIDNARLYDDGRRQRAWIEAVGEVAQSLLEREDEQAAIRLMTEHACRLSLGSHAVLALQDEADDLGVRAICRVDGEELVHEMVPPGQHAHLDGLRWARTRRVRTPALEVAPSSGSAAAGIEVDVVRVAGVAPGSPMAVFPLSPGRGDLGVLVVAWDAEADLEPTHALPALTEYAQQVGLALLASRAQRGRSRMALVDDRDRIARDMHDRVIQRLFATGLSLQSASRIAQHPTVRVRLDEAVDDLDTAIKEIRQAIFELHAPRRDVTAAEELADIVATFSSGLGFEPDLVLRGDLSELGPSTRSDVLAVVSEGLSNISRHAHASRAQVEVVVDDHLSIDIADDGVGMDTHQPRSGLVNLHDRATTARGSFGITQNVPTGTLLRWRVPVVVT